jgi:hypothetical protein
MSFSHLPAQASRYSRAWLLESGLEEDPEEKPHVVSYPGMWGEVRRELPNRERAEQWARQAGVLSKATIYPA